MIKNKFYFLSFFLVVFNFSIYSVPTEDSSTNSEGSALQRFGTTFSNGIKSIASSLKDFPNKLKEELNSLNYDNSTTFKVIVPIKIGEKDYSFGIEIVLGEPGSGDVSVGFVQPKFTMISPSINDIFSIKNTVLKGISD